MLKASRSPPQAKIIPRAHSLPQRRHNCRYPHSKTRQQQFPVPQKRFVSSPSRQKQSQPKPFSLNPTTTGAQHQQLLARSLKQPHPPPQPPIPMSHHTTTSPRQTNPAPMTNNNSSNSGSKVWSLATDIVTARTALFLSKHLKSKLDSSHEPQQRIQQEQQQTITTSFGCDDCLLTNHHCVCPEFPNRLDLTNNLAKFADVIVYAHSSEVAGLTASNTARFLPKHGAFPVIMGDFRGESILRNIILSRPRDSTFVLFPSPTSMTPAEFMERFDKVKALSDPQAQHPFPDRYPPIDPSQLLDLTIKNQHIDSQIQDYHNAHLLNQSAAVRAKKIDLGQDPTVEHLLRIQQGRVYIENNITNLIDDTIAKCFPGFYSDRPFYTQMHHTSQTHNGVADVAIPGGCTIKPLVIVLDGTWPNAKTLDRRLTLLLSESFKTNQYSESERLLTDLTITPATYLHRVRVTRALRSDVGQLRRLQTSERSTVAGAGLGFKSVTAIIPPSNTPNISQQSQSLQSLKPLPTGLTDDANAMIPPISTTLPNLDNTTVGHATTILKDDDSIQDNSGGKVSTLHAFLVLLEEMYDLPTIQSHRDLPSDKENIKQALQDNQDPKYEEKSTVLDIVAGFTQILQAMVIGYHTQKGLSKAQLLDPETRQIVKTKYQAFLDKKSQGRQELRDVRYAAKHGAKPIEVTTTAGGCVFDATNSSPPPPADTQTSSDSDIEPQMVKRQRVGDSHSGSEETVSLDDCHHNRTPPQ